MKYIIKQLQSTMAVYANVYADNISVHQVKETSTYGTYIKPGSYSIYKRKTIKVTTFLKKDTNARYAAVSIRVCSD